MTVVLAFTSCHNNKLNDYAVTWGPENVVLSFEGTPEQVDSLNAASEQILSTVYDIYTEELMKLDAEKDTAMLIFRNTTPADVKNLIKDPTDKVEQTLASINTPVSMDGMYFEINMYMRGLSEEYEEMIYSNAFGDKSLLHK